MNKRIRQGISDFYTKNSIVGYTPGFVLLRFVTVSTIALGSLILMLVIFDKSMLSQMRTIHYIIIIFSYNVLTESQIILDHILEYLFPVPRKLRLRLTLQIGCGFVLLFLTYKVIINFIDPRISNHELSPYIYTGMVLGLFFVSIITNVLTIFRMTEKWYYSTRQLDILKQEKLQMNYNSLQDRLNPHFLFNNLTVLKGLIYTDIDAASLFIENFSDVYRYILKNSDNQFVTLTEELEFLKAYLDLHKARLKEGLKVIIEIDEEQKYKSIAPLTLQLLVENSIKHNIADFDNPLTIYIIYTAGYIEVKNTIHKKENTYSTKMGLQNLVERYNILSDKRIIIEDDGVTFTVKVPLINEYNDQDYHN